MSTAFQNANIYFETSAVNFFADKHDINDAIATKGRQLVNNNHWYLSPVTIWELLLTTDKPTRERLISISQNLFYEKLLLSPAEIIVSFLKADWPRYLSFDDFYSKEEVAIVWTRLCNDPLLTFIYDDTELIQLTKHLKDLSKKMDETINSIVLEIAPEKTSHQFALLIDHFYNSTAISKRTSEPSVVKVHKAALVFIFYYLCVGLDALGKTISSFWTNIGLDKLDGRMEYILKNYPKILEYGPFIEFGLMAVSQIEISKKPNRGLFHDSLHCIYLPFIDLFITNDRHFDDYGHLDILNHHNKIVHVDRLLWDQRMTPITPRTR